jgi:hypothetical protein
MTTQLVWDAFKGLLISLRPPTIFPAAVFVLTNVYLFTPYLAPGFEPGSTQSVVLWIGLIVLCSYMLHGMGYKTMQILMGHGWKDTFLGRLLVKRHLRRRRLLEKASLPKGQRNYPSSYVCPTAFGNKIQAVYEYPVTRYGIDWLVLASRFEPILVDKKYQPFIDKEKDVLQLFVNMSTISVVLSLEFLYVFLFLGKFAIALAGSISSLGIAFFFYNCTSAPIDRWGEAVRTACDLYRHDLMKQLGLRPTETFGEECDRWKAISRFILYRKPTYRSFRGFVSQSRMPIFKDVMECLGSTTGEEE